MKTLIFSRHAKSSWSDISLSDIERPLNQRGRRDAPVMARKVQEKISHIEFCVMSPSQRTRETAAYYQEVFDFDQVEVVQRLYHASIDDVLDTISMLDDQYNSAILFGHNPTFTFLYDHFAHDDLDNLPTSGVFFVQSRAQSWSDIDTTNSEVVALLYPKMYL